MARRGDDDIRCDPCAAFIFVGGRSAWIVGALPRVHTGFAMTLYLHPPRVL